MACIRILSGDRQFAVMMRRMSGLRTLYVLMALLASTGRGRSFVQDHCDTTLWDIDNGAVGVQDVTGSCAEGRIDWHSPYGAIRISLLLSPHPEGIQNASFESCFQAWVHLSSVKVFLDDAASGLTPLVTLSPASPRMDRELCIRTAGAEPVLLYIESELSGESAARGLVKVDYENRALPETGQRQDKDCRPCTQSEILEAVCRSDLVFAGTMDHVTHNPELDETALHLKVTRMLRQRRNVGEGRPLRYPEKAWRRSPRLRYHSEHGVLDWRADDDEQTTSGAGLRQSDAVLFAPYECAIRRGPGEFMFTANVRFQRALLYCAPRMHEFAELWRRAKEAGRHHCSLE